MKASSILRSQGAYRLYATGRIFCSRVFVAKALTLFVFAACLSLPARAQTPAAPQPGSSEPGQSAEAVSAVTASTASALPLYGPRPVWLKGYPRQLKASMRSPIRQVREEVLVTLIVLLQQPGYDLALKAPATADALVPTLLAVYAGARHPRERQMAATAICLLGKERSGIEALVALSDEDRDRFVQRRARRAIAAYYTQTYPELAEWIAKRGGKRTLLTKARIERAERRQARAERLAAEAAQEEVLLSASEEQNEPQER